MENSRFLIKICWRTSTLINNLVLFHQVLFECFQFWNERLSFDFVVDRILISGFTKKLYF
jgi:hypothetical protein